MTPSERIILIREVARRLAPEDWTIIDLTLNQFTLPTQYGWSGERDGYIIEMISQADEKILIELASHLGFQVENQLSALEPPFWLDGHFRLFISHLAANKDIVSSIQEHLQLRHISSFVAHRDILPTKQWEEEILLALSTCDALLGILHPGFHQSKWTDQEIGFAIGKGKLVFSLRAGEDPYGFIGRFQAINGIGKDTDVTAKEIFDCLLAHKQTASRMAYALVHKLEQSGSFKSANTNFALVREATYWDKSLADRLEASIANNSQVSGAWGLPEAIRAFISDQ